MLSFAVISQNNATSYTAEN